MDPNILGLKGHGFLTSPISHRNERGVGDYTSLNRPSEVLIIGLKAPYPQLTQ